MKSTASPTALNGLKKEANNNGKYSSKSFFYKKKDDTSISKGKGTLRGIQTQGSSPASLSPDVGCVPVHLKRKGAGEKERREGIK